MLENVQNIRQSHKLHESQIEKQEKLINKNGKKTVSIFQGTNWSDCTQKDLDNAKKWKPQERLNIFL